MPSVAPLVLGRVAVMHRAHRLVRLVRPLLLLPVRQYVAPPRTVPIHRALPRPPVILRSRCIVVSFVRTAAVALRAPGRRAMLHMLLLLRWPLIRVPPRPGAPLRVRLLVRPLPLRRYGIVPRAAVGGRVVGIRGRPVVLLTVRHVLWVVMLLLLLLPPVLGPPALLLPRRGGLLQRHWHRLLVGPLCSRLQDEDQGGSRRALLQHQGCSGCLQHQRSGRAGGGSGEERGGRRGGAVRREELLVLRLCWQQRLRRRGRRGRGHDPGVEAEVLVQQRRGQRVVCGQCKRQGGARARSVRGTEGDSSKSPRAYGWPKAADGVAKWSR